MVGDELTGELMTASCQLNGEPWGSVRIFRLLFGANRLCLVKLNVVAAWQSLSA